MGICFINGEPPSHPIQEIEYPLVQRKFSFGSETLIIEELVDVEDSIDIVFKWLESKNLPASEIEHLAPYFGKIWPAALGLAQWVADEGKKLKNKTLLEIGCGLGMPGLLASKLGATVTLSDGHPDVARFLERNLKINNISTIDFVTPNWHTGQVCEQKFDYVIASDVLYESYHPDFFAKIFDTQASSKGVIVLTDPGRAYIQRFIKNMNGLNWVENLEPWTVPVQGSSADIYLLRFERKV